MKPEFKEAIKLHNQGFTPEEISEELSISRATAFRWIKQHKASLALTGIDEEFVEDEFEQSVLDDEPKEIDHQTLSGIEKSNQLKERELDLLEKRDFVEKEKTKRSVLKEFKDLLTGIREYAQGYKWGHKEVAQVVTRIEEIEESLQEVFDFDEDEMCENSTCQIMGVLSKEFGRLEESGDEYSFSFNWSKEKLDMLDFGISLENLDDDEFDLDDFNRQSAWNEFTRFIDLLKQSSGESVGTKEVDSFKGSLDDLREELNSDTRGVTGEFVKELGILGEIEKLLSEYSIRIEESIWGSKRFYIKESLSDKISELINSNQEDQ